MKDILEILFIFELLSMSNTVNADSETKNYGGHTVESTAVIFRHCLDVDSSDPLVLFYSNHTQMLSITRDEKQLLLFPPQKLILYRKRIKHIVLFDYEDYDLISQYLWFIDQDGYVVGYRKDIPTTQKRWVKMHRLLMGDKIVKTNPVDHINHNRTDNRKINLRICSTFQNSLNCSILNKHKFRGVNYRHGRYTARIHVDGVRLHLGCFETAEEASRVYRDAAKKYHNETINI